MQNFRYHNPTEVVFGKGSIAELSGLIPEDAVVLMTYGGGSIRANGVYDQVAAALAGRRVVEFGGIEPNPRYETCMKAVALAREQGATFLLSVGGGSVLDGTKFIAAAVPFAGDDPWDILAKGAEVKSALPVGCVLTLPATGSETNGFAVVSRDATNEKLAFFSPRVYPKFAVLDPETTASLPQRQVANGIVDAFAHVLEQYMTGDMGAPLQDRQAEAVLCTLVEQGPRAVPGPADYGTRANIMWAATQALNGIIACGVAQDWATHLIGHELTALYGLDHGQTLAVVFPATLRHQRARKAAKLLQYAARVWNITEGAEEQRIEAAIARTEDFFRSLGVKTRLAEYGIREGLERVGQRIEARGQKIGEHADLGRKEIDEILALCAE
ncbi:MAG TPA: iron-containing alcohol dehydrogenase [Candidatus Hydrogenedentes bacterium]|nr:iron-containing alcohol dehydrogenase [Candidatus Hydrogenedentota bacterium]